MSLLLLFIFLAVGVSFACSIMEATLLSVTPQYAAALQREGRPAGHRLARLKEDIDRPLAAILSLNTIANTAGAVGVGVQAEAVLGSSWVGLVSAGLTLLILVCSEIIPKSLGVAHWRRLAPGVSRILVGMVLILHPFVWLARHITKILAPAADGDAVSPAEIAAMATLGEEQGVFDEGESLILQNVLRLRSLRVSDIMTPRTVVSALAQDDTVAAVVEELRSCTVSRLPVYGESLDEVTGYILRDEVLLEADRGDGGRPLTALRRTIEVVPASLPLTTLFDRFLSTGALIAVAVDEYGGTAGLVTMEDLIETLIGKEIVDEMDRAPDMQELARRQWRHRSRRTGLLAEDGTDAIEKRRTPG